MNRDLSSGGSAEADSFLVAAAAFRDAITSHTQVVSAETSATADLTTNLFAENEGNFRRRMYGYIALECRKRRTFFEAYVPINSSGVKE